MGAQISVQKIYKEIKFIRLAFAAWENVTRPQNTLQIHNTLNSGTMCNINYILKYEPITSAVC